MKAAPLLLAAACAQHPPPARIENHAAPATVERFELDAPLFSSDPTDHVEWTLDRQGASAAFTLGDEPVARGTFEEHDGTIVVEVANGNGATRLDCKRTAMRVHVAGAEPHERGEHPACDTPRVWEPAELRTEAVLACTVHREQLVTQVTMSGSPGLQAVVDDCCDDQDRCERRWEIRRRPWPDETHDRR